MKKLLALGLTGLLLSACGSAPGQIAASRVAVGVSADDSEAMEVAKRTVTPATETTPEKVTWAVTPGGGVTFTFMTRPGSDAVYLSGYRIVRERLTTVNGTTTQTDFERTNKTDLYLTSGFTCATRDALTSCPYNGAEATPANGAPASLTINLEAGLGNIVASTNASVSQVTDLEFYGTSSNGQAVTVSVDGVVSRGSKQGD